MTPRCAECADSNAPAEDWAQDLNARDYVSGGACQSSRPVEAV